MAAKGFKSLVSTDSTHRSNLERKTRLNPRPDLGKVVPHQLSYFRRGLVYYGYKDSVFRVYKFFFYFYRLLMTIVLPGIRDAITTAYPLTDTDLSLIVQVVSPAAGYACGITAFSCRARIYCRQNNSWGRPNQQTGREVVVLLCVRGCWAGRQ